MKPESIIYPAEKSSLYRLLGTQLQGLTDGVADLTANLANIAALLNQALTEINWVGFYMIKNGRLILGPFQGKPACVEIPVGCGVCGTAAARDEILSVENVHEFPGHIACDSASKSEIVIPIHKNGEVVGVLDIDSPVVGRFDEEDQKGLSGLMQVFEKLINCGSGDRLEALNGRIKKFIDERGWNESRTPSNMAKSISIEAAELLECFQWDDEDYNRKHVLEELADVMNYCIQMTQVLDVDIVEMIHSKMDITEKKYPVNEADKV